MTYEEAAGKALENFTAEAEAHIDWKDFTPVQRMLIEFAVRNAVLDGYRAGLDDGHDIAIKANKNWLED